jgi:DNA repair photolyase
MRVVEIPCATALVPSLLAGYDWALNPYRGCAFDCLYCYAPDVVRMERSQWASTIFVKRSAPTVLARELRRKQRGVIGISTVTDPYQPVERRLEVTRRCLEVVVRAGWPVSILTKSPMVTRDLDLLRRIPGAEVGFSIATADDEERKRWESRCPPMDARFDALRAVARAGVRAFVFAGPLYPESSIEGVRELARRAYEAGAAEVMVDGLHPRPGALLQVMERTAPVPRSAWGERTALLVRGLGEECAALGLPCSGAKNWKPAASDGDRNHLVAARATEERAPVLQQPREVGGLLAPLADPFPVDVGLQEFD